MEINEESGKNNKTKNNKNNNNIIAQVGIVFLRKNLHAQSGILLSLVHVWHSENQPILLLLSDCILLFFSERKKKTVMKPLKASTNGVLISTKKETTTILSLLIPLPLEMQYIQKQDWTKTFAISRIKAILSLN